MRTLSALLALVALSAFAFSSPGHAGPSGTEKLQKLARKYAVEDGAVFEPDVKPKTLCYCTAGDRSLGFLVFTPALDLLCAVPFAFDGEGDWTVVDYGCTDFEILAR